MRNLVQCNGRTFTDDDIVRGECHIARSLLSSSLEVETLEFEVYSTDTTLTTFEVDSQVVYIYNGVRIRTFFLQEVMRESKYIYSFKAVSVAGVLDKKDYYGGIYTGQLVRDVVADICKNFPITVAANVAGIKLYGWLPISTRREALAQVLFAISATIKDDVNGMFTIAGLSQDQTRVVGRDDTSEDAKIKYSTSAIDVVVLEHQYTEGTEETTLFEGTTSNGDVITFNEPCHSLVSTGFNITEQGANYAIVTSGSGKLTGKKYVHSTREIKGKRTVTKDITVDKERNVRVEDATLVSLVNSRAVADRLADYYAKSERIIADVSYGQDDAGDVLSQYHPYDDMMVQTCIESLDVKMSGQLLANMTSLVGYIPPDISQIEYFDTFEVLTGSGTWVGPTGAKNARAVLIGAGTGGSSGTNGIVGEMKPQPIASSAYAGKYGLGGEGGKGGQPGTPGKILQVELENVDGKSFSYRCGVAGKGGPGNSTESNPGTSGTATTFGSYSSDNGSIPETGFMNPINKTVYAKKGDVGVDGAKGGRGGYFDANDREEKNIHGVDGEDVDNAKGGPGALGYWGSGRWARAGGGGGGAANNKSGGPGKDHNNGGVGGDGASPDKPETPTYGSAGHGGHGGGGPGGGGGYVADRPAPDPDDIKDLNTPGKIGIGSDGGDAGPGCVIVFYSLPKKPTS